MTRTIEYQNPERTELIKKLKSKNSAAIYKAAALELSKVRKNRREVNIRKINELTKEGDVVMVPGKVLGEGLLDHKVEISAFSFTEDAKNKIKKSGSIAITLGEIIEKNPSGSNIKLIC